METIHLYDDKIGKIEYVDHMGSDLTIVNAARVSFGAHSYMMKEKDKKLINYLLKHQHTSPFEHCSVTFRIKVPLFVRSQHHRHRMQSINEISRRYTSEDIEFYEPNAFRKQHANNRQASTEELFDPFISIGRKNDMGMILPASTMIKNFHLNALKLYEQMIELGICREQARGVLPQNMYTEYYSTINLHNLYKFIILRMHEGAQWEIQKLAEGMLKIARELFPVATEAFIENIQDESLKEKMRNVK